jgi:spore germination protein KA
MRRLSRPLIKLGTKKKILKQSEKEVKDEHVLDTSIDNNQSSLKNIFGKTSDIIFREFEFFYQHPNKVIICYLDGIVSEDYINLNILKPLMEPNYVNHHSTNEDLFMIVKNRILTSLKIKELKKH